MMKRGILPVLCLLFLLLGGCSPELHERLPVQGIGVDLMPDGDFRTTVCFENEDGEISAFCGEGQTVPAALEAAAASADKLPLYAHMEWIVFGRDCAAAGLENCVDFFIRHYDSRPDVRILISDGTAEAALCAEQKKDESGISATESSTPVYAGSTETDLIALVNGSCAAGGGVILPLITSKENTGKAGAVLLKDMRYAAVLSRNSVLGYMLLTEKIESGETVVHSSKHGKVSLTAGDSFCEIRFTGTKEAPRFRIDARIEGEISSMKTGMKPVAREVFTELERLYAQQMTESIHAYLSEVVYAEGCDAAGLMHAVHRDAPAVWEEIREDAAEFMQNAVFDITVEGRIDRVEEEDSPYF